MKTILPFPKNDAHFTLLIASQDADLTTLLRWAAQDWGIRVVCVQEVEEYSGRADVLLLDESSQADSAALTKWQQRWSDAKTIQLVDDWQPENAFALTKPFTLTALQMRLAQLLPNALASAVNA